MIHPILQSFWFSSSLLQPHSTSQPSAFDRFRVVWLRSKQTYLSLTKPSKDLPVFITVQFSRFISRAVVYRRQVYILSRLFGFVNHFYFVYLRVYLFFAGGRLVYHVSNSLSTPFYLIYLRFCFRKWNLILAWGHRFVKQIFIHSYSKQRFTPLFRTIRCSPLPKGSYPKVIMFSIKESTRPVMV